MVRLSKQARKRSKSPHRPRPPSLKTGPKKESLPQGFKPIINAVEGDLAKKIFIPKVASLL